MENMYHLVFYFKQLRVLEQTTKTQLFPSSFSSIRWRCVLVITKKILLMEIGLVICYSIYNYEK